METGFIGKTIILSAPNHFELPFRIKENLEFLGFTVHLLLHKEGFSLKKQDSIKHFFNKTFKKDKTLKAKKRAEFSEQKLLFELNEISTKTDYALIIRPDLLSEKTIKKIKEKAKMTVAYQWDGIDRFPLAKEVMPYFDRFFLFDVRDLKKHPNCLPTTNFYFDDLMDTTEVKNDVFFVGTFMKNRINEILELSRLFKKTNIKAEIFIKVKKLDKKYENENLILTTDQLSFKENLIHLKESKTILDFKNDIHYGLSFRTFESIGFKKKLITNNSLVKSYDFYNPKNIFILEENYSQRELINFLKQPYQDMSPEITDKYSFTNWIKYLLSIDPHQKINLHFEGEKLG